MEFPLKLENLTKTKKSWKLDSVLRLTEKYLELCKNLEAWMEKAPDDPSIEASMLKFEEQTGLDQLHELTPGLNHLDHPQSLPLLMQSLAPYYMSGFLLESLRGGSQASWWATGFFFKGQWFDLELSDQIRVPTLPRLSPLQVKRALTAKALSELGLPQLPHSLDAQSFLFRPTDVTALLLNTEVPELFARLKVDTTLNLAHRYFNP